MKRDTYVIRGGREGRERLRVLTRVMRPTTLALFARVGLHDGMACLDVGCGGGEVTREIAALVAPGGRAVGIDRDAALIEIVRRETAETGLANLAFRVAEVGGPVDASAFDLVYARFLLTHLLDPGAAVTWMLERLRPGGALVVEDIDFRGHFCHPANRAFDRYVEIYTAVVRRAGADPEIGPRLATLLLDAGCRNVGVHVVQPAGIDGEVKQMAALTLANVTAAAEAAELATRAELDALVDALRAFAADPRSLMSLPRVVQAWGRRAT